MAKIAIISDTFPPLPSGGIAVAHYNLFRVFVSAGHDVMIFTYLDHYGKKPIVPEVASIKRFGISRRQASYDRLKNRYLGKIQRFIKKNTKPKNGLAYQVDLIRMSGVGSRKINKPLIAYEPDFVFVPDFGAPAQNLVKVPGATYVYLSHHNPIRFINNPLLPGHSVTDARQAVALEQKSLPLFDVVVCPSTYMKYIFQETFTFEKEVVVLPNILDWELISRIQAVSVHSKLGIDPDLPVVYIPSANSSIKGERFIVEIVRRISRHFGNRIGFYLSSGLSDAQRFELSHVQGIHLFVPGKVSFEENISYIKSCKLCISPTMLESYGMALFEALLCGLPSVSFDVGGNRDFIDGQVGKLVPFLDVEALIEQAIAILDIPELFASMQSKIAEFVQHYRASKPWEDYLSILNDRH